MREEARHVYLMHLLKGLLSFRKWAKACSPVAATWFILDMCCYCGTHSTCFLVWNAWTGDCDAHERARIHMACLQRSHACLQISYTSIRRGSGEKLDDLSGYTLCTVLEHLDNQAMEPVHEVPRKHTSTEYELGVVPP